MNTRMAQQSIFPSHLTPASAMLAEPTIGIALTRLTGAHRQSMVA